MEKAIPQDQCQISLASQAILVALQTLLGISTYQFIIHMLYREIPSWEPYMASMLGTVAAIVTAFLLLYKYQTLIEEITLENHALEQKAGEGAAELEKANAEMRLEIAERQRVEQALSASEARFRTIIREAAIGMAVLDKEGRFTESNLALQIMLGYSPEELRGRPFTQVIHPDDAHQGTKLLEELLEGKRGTYQRESRYIHQNGWEVWGCLSISLVRDPGGKPQFTIAMIEDITQRRQAEEKIRTYQKHLQSLASELSLIEERERRDLATNLHDDIGQTLAVARIKLCELRHGISSPELEGQTEEIRQLIDQSIQSVRSLTFELSPPILYDLGFEAAVEWLAETMQKRYDIQIQVQTDDETKPLDLDNEVSVLLFRSMRELIFNVIKHARASQVEISMEKLDKDLRITVQDNGVGFHTTRIEQAKVSGFGLFSIRERLNYFGGSLKIESSPGQGTKAIMAVPLRNNRKRCARTRSLKTAFT
jgi:PAS domain S-box-containing protein